MLSKKEEKSIVIKRESKDGEKSIKFRQSFKHVILLKEYIYWLYPIDWKQGQPIEYTWNTMSMRFFFPKRNMIYAVALKPCIGAFSKS